MLKITDNKINMVNIIGDNSDHIIIENCTINNLTIQEKEEKQEEKQEED